MSKLYLFVLLLLFTSCSKEEEKDNEYATGNEKVGIVGKWKLVSTETDNGGGDLTVSDRTSENTIMTLDSKGIINSSRMGCAGRYSFVARENLTHKVYSIIITQLCEVNGKPSVEYIREHPAGFRDNNTLFISNDWCFKGCSDIYRRLKD